MAPALGALAVSGRSRMLPVIALALLVAGAPASFAALFVYFVAVAAALRAAALRRSP